MWEGFTRRGSLFFFPSLLRSSSCCLSASHLKYSITVHAGSGQRQEAEMIGSAQISMGMCDQSVLLRAFPSLHLLHERACARARLCPIVPDQRCPLSFHSPLDHCALSDVLMLPLITFTVCCRARARVHGGMWPHPSLLFTKRFIRIWPIALIRSFSSTVHRHAASFLMTFKQIIENILI